MDSKLQELTEKIYREGVEKGEQQAGEIIAAAEKQSADIIDAARRDADEILAGARQKAEDLRQNIEADMRLSCSQAVQAFRQQITDALVFEAVDKPVAAALSNPETITDFLKAILQSWNPAGGEAPTLAVLLPESKRSELDQALKSALQDQLSKGLLLQFSKNIKGGFQIQPAGSAYKISFADDDFTEFLKEYLRPKTRNFLFGS
jgi:V/A-type H+-transporting ATPase subunit E